MINVRSTGLTRSQAVTESHGKETQGRLSENSFRKGVVQEYQAENQSENQAEDQVRKSHSKLVFQENINNNYDKTNSHGNWTLLLCFCYQVNRQYKWPWNLKQLNYETLQQQTENG